MRAELAIFGNEPLGDEVDGLIRGQRVARLDRGLARHRSPQRVQILLASGEHFADEFTGGGPFEQRRHGAYFQHRAGALIPQGQGETERGQGVVEFFQPFAFGGVQGVFEGQDQRLGHA